MLQIGDFARLGGVTTKTLRLYDRRGIFTPAWVDPDTRYRYYSPAQLPELRRILALTGLGVPLAEVAGLVVDGADLRAVLERRRATLEAERDRVSQRLAELEIRVAMVDEGPDVVVRRIPEERVALIETDISLGDSIGPLFYEVESIVRDAGGRSPQPPGVVVERSGERARVRVYVPVRRAVQQGRVVTATLPAVMAATVVHRGPYEGMAETRRALEAWVEAAGHRAIGPERIVYLQFGAEPELEVPGGYLVGSSRDFVTELQIPIG